LTGKLGREGERAGREEKKENEISGTSLSS